MTMALVGNPTVTGLLNLHAVKAGAGSAALVNVATGIALVVPAGKRLLMIEGSISIGGNAATIVLEDEDGNDIGPVLTSPAVAGGYAQRSVPTLRVPTAAKSAKITTTGADAVGAFWCSGYLERATS
jgi:hypothetical protein